MHSPLLISGPSGIGKSHLARHLSLNYGCQRVVPITTRAMRPGEVQGRDYQFLKDHVYLALREKNELFMDNEFFGSKYGFTWQSVTTIVERGLMPLAEIYVPKIYQFLEAFPESRTIFLMPESEQQLIDNMTHRGESQENIVKRVNEGRKEVSLYLTEYYPAYMKCYQYTERNFKEIVRDLMDTVGIEGQILYEGNSMMRR